MMKKAFSSTAVWGIVATLIAGATASAAGTWEVQPADATVGLSFLDQKALLDGLYETLTMDFEFIDESTTLVYRPDAKETSILGNRPLPRAGEEAQLIHVGVNGAVDQAVSFAGADLSAVGPKPTPHAGGVLRLNDAGEFVWTIGISSPNAGGLRVELAEFALADGAELYLYNWSGEVYEPYTGAGPNGDGSFWSNSIGGETAFLELRAPNAAILATSAFRIISIAHLDHTLFPNPANKKCDYTEACMLDANCFTNTDFPALSTARRAIGRMLITTPQGQGLCTGQLIRDTDDNSEIPYFLTANHCLSTASSASSLEVTWQFTTPSCDAPCPEPTAGFQKSLGSRLLATGPTPQSTDFTLLRLNQQPPTGTSYLGWTLQNTQGAGITLYRLSHPAGAPLQYTRVLTTPDNFCDGFAPRQRFVYTVPQVGAAEGGSSGSAIMTAQGLVVGQLLGVCGFGIDQPCQDVNAYRTVDGAFRVTYNAIADFLDPPDPVPLPYPSEWFLPEGATFAGFDTYVLVSNPNAGTINVDMTLLAESKPNQSFRFSVPAYSRYTVLVDDLLANDGVSVALREVDGNGFVAERTMYAVGQGGRWSGAHSSTAIAEPSPTWYFAEGSTVQTGGPGTNFQTYFLVANPNTTEKTIEATFFPQSGASFSRQFKVGPQRRLTIEAGSVIDSRLANTSFSTQLRTLDDSEVFAERAMWWKAAKWPLNAFTDGTASPGLPSLSTNWYFAEGNTIDVDEFLLLVNPTSTAATVEITYMLQAATPVVRQVVLPPASRTTINVRFDAQGVGSATRHGISVSSNVAIAAERSMYISSGGFIWASGHNTVGAPATANAWVLPEGAQFDDFNTDILLANPSANTVAVNITFLLQDGTQERLDVNIPSRQRVTVHASDVRELKGKAFSTTIFATEKIVAERSSYFKAAGVENGGATCSMGLPLNVTLTKEVKDAIIRSASALVGVDGQAIPTPTVTPTVTPTPVVP
jgi:hypothetical protein